MDKIKKFLNKFKENKSGFSSLLFVTLSLIIVEMMAIFMILLYKSYAFNEVQGVMDITGINTLYKTVDAKYFRDEYLSIIGEKDSEIDMNGGSSSEGQRENYKMPKKVKQKLLKTYQQELDTWLATNGGDGDVIEGMTAHSIDASIEYSSWGTGDKFEKKTQLMMDGFTEVRINAHLSMDPLGGMTHVPIFTTHGGGTTNFSIQSVNYDAQAGHYVVIVRSMVRMIIAN